MTTENEKSRVDNATGSSNFAAKGAHRLMISLSWTEKTSTTDSFDFINLSNIVDGKLEDIGRSTQYSILAEEMARRTNDESGSYTVRPFQFRVEESIDTNVSGTSFQGTYSKGETTKDNNTANESLLSFIVSRGKLILKVFEIERSKTRIKAVINVREIESLNDTTSTFVLGNFAFIQNGHRTTLVTKM